MSLTIVLSGPKSSQSQARNALASAGITVHATVHDHGLEDLSHPGQPDAYLTVEHSDINQAHQTVEPLGWRLRAHWHTPEPKPPRQDLMATIEAMQRRLNALEAKTRRR